MALRFLFLALVSIIVLNGCADQVVYGTPPSPPPASAPPPGPPPAPDYYPPPPAPLYDPVPPPPFYGAIWVGGSYYRWHHGWRWRHGYYRHP